MRRPDVLVLGGGGTLGEAWLRAVLAGLEEEAGWDLRGCDAFVVFGAPRAPPASVADAVLASCAVPWVFRPVTIGGREYVDGGAWSSANLDAAPVRRGTEVLCLNPTASPRLAADRFGAVRAFAGAGAATEALLLRGRGARVRIVAPDGPSVAAIGPNLLDARRRAAVEGAGYRQGRALASRA
jgi:NTE family protein